jgi:hypothetical protein
MSEKTQKESKSSCPCKKLPLCLSSFTAAEYGDLHSLSRAVVDRTDAGGYTALHLAAQHGHSAATALLLKMGARVDGNDSNGATPLHRAAFAGAVGPMQMLVDAGASLLAQDSSFGDLQTPLHKAAAGGRPLAVQLLLKALKGTGEQGLGLGSTDARGRTPLMVARELQAVSVDEAESVKRWNSVAGGLPDWNQCVSLLSQRHETNELDGKNKTKMPILPSTSSLCEGCVDGYCRIASWEDAFRSVLESSMPTITPKTLPSHYIGTPLTAPQVLFHLPIHPTTVSEQQEKPHKRIMPSVGKMCALCGDESFAFSRLDDDLVCSKCSKKRRYVAN